MANSMMGRECSVVGLVMDDVLFGDVVVSPSAPCRYASKPWAEWAHEFVLVVADGAQKTSPDPPDRVVWPCLVWLLKYGVALEFVASSSEDALGETGAFCVAEVRNRRQ